MIPEPRLIKMGEKALRPETAVGIRFPVREERREGRAQGRGCLRLTTVGILFRVD